MMMASPGTGSVEAAAAAAARRRSNGAGGAPSDSYSFYNSRRAAVGKLDTVRFTGSGAGVVRPRALARDGRSAVRDVDLAVARMEETAVRGQRRRDAEAGAMHADGCRTDQCVCEGHVECFGDG